MKIILTAIENSLAKAWKEFCGGLGFIEIHHGSILDVECDAVVSPANSFGFMDGGIDAVYMNHFGHEVQTKARKQILEHHNGELIVGNADVIETEDDEIPFLIIAPTMRVPMILTDTVNPYLAARAVFILIQERKFLSGSLEDEQISKHIKTVAFPGLGTGVGQVEFNICANQMRKAIDEILLEKYKMPNSWTEASERHQLLYTSNLKRLQH